MPSKALHNQILVQDNTGNLETAKENGGCFNLAADGLIAAGLDMSGTADIVAR